ncbi:family 43 glycosylhydrolase [Paenibacillus hexagrammi]|uniref:Family 43 glycosylhydrolase n=1 Tax=Paenibacillus hexagrammi TaxID=2908839 RepID=A0ABY3SNS3_9BACL|nr:family 43 glycosylhydrolase [Paenibacillus sp. YPD9-1]UJF35708.1 family 43 glycosylhydrolase [Paenibacillus sp. YPD9-1]
MSRKKGVAIFAVCTILVSLFSGTGAAPVSASAEEQTAYVMSYHTKGTSGTSMSYMDDSLHLAYSYDQTHWTALNDNNGILFKKNPGYKANPANGLQMEDPYLFRKQDGTFVLLATSTNSAGSATSSSIFAWDTTDFIHYTNERSIQMNSTGAVAKTPQVKYDSTSKNYIIYWTNGTQNYANTTTDFVTVSAPSAYSGMDYPAAKPDLTYAPEKSIFGSMVSVTPEELAKVTARLGTPKMPVGSKSIKLQTQMGEAPELPETGEVIYSDGSSASKSVSWESVDPSQYVKEGSFKVQGTLSGMPDYMNPLIKNGADPNIYKGADGYYYYTSSYMDASHNLTASYQYDKIALRRAATIQGLATAEEKIIWTKHSSGAMSYHIWAPELHYYQGKWYIYFAAGTTTSNFDLRVYVLECSAQDPMTGAWNELGKVSMNDEAFDLDATTFEHNGELYMIYAFANGSQSVNSSLRIAKMTSPTTLGSEQVNIATPEYTWEQRRDNVNEGPAVIKKNGKIFVAYSAGSTDSTYAVGLLTAVDSPDTNLLDPASWIKTPYPIMATAPQNGQFGPGHGTFTVSEDGTQDVFVYHARENERYSGVSGYNPLYDASRWARVQNVYWHDDGTPYLGVPVPDGHLPGSAVEATVQVAGPAGAVYLAEEEMTIEANASKVIVLKKSNGDGTSSNVTASATFTSSAPQVADVTQTGLIKAKSQGSADITVAYGGKTYTVHVTVPASVSGDNLLLWYKFDETSGTTAADASGHGNDGTYIRTPAFGSGVHGGSFKMAGGAAGSTTSPYVKIPNGLLKDMNNITISTYVKWNGGTTNNQWIYALGVDSNKYIFATPRNSSSRLYSAITVSSYPAEQGLLTGAQMDANVWKLLTVVYDSEHHTATMYVDGVEVLKNTNLTLKPSDLYDATKDYSGYVGKSFYNDPYFPGEVDDFRIYNKALTAWEVLQLKEEDHADAVARDTAALTLGDTSAITANLELPTSGNNGSTITWASNDPAVIEDSGAVHRPLFEAGNKTVILTATISQGSIQDTKEFTVTVLKEEAPLPSGMLSAPASVSSGQSFDVTYTVNNAAERLYAQDITMAYDPEQVEFVAAESLQEGWKIAAVSDPSLTPGSIRIIAASVGDDVQTNGDLFKIT